MTEDSTPPDDGAIDEPTLEERTRRLHRHLEATAELPVDREANRWLGEAEAIARDVATSDLDRETVSERVGKVRRLLSAVDDTGHDEANDHLEAATEVSAAILDGDEEELPDE